MSEEKNVPLQEQSSTNVTAKPTWHRPTVTRIDMRCTMFPANSGGNQFTYLDVNMA